MAEETSQKKLSKEEIHELLKNLDYVETLDKDSLEHNHILSGLSAEQLGRLVFTGSLPDKSIGKIRQYYWNAPEFFTESVQNYLLYSPARVYYNFHNSAPQQNQLHQQQTSNQQSV